MFKPGDRVRIVLNNGHAPAEFRGHDREVHTVIPMPAGHPHDDGFGIFVGGDWLRLCTSLGELTGYGCAVQLVTRFKSVETLWHRSK